MIHTDAAYRQALEHLEEDAEAIEVQKSIFGVLESRAMI
jgi:hypothetical protein